VPLCVEVTTGDPCVVSHLRQRGLQVVHMKHPLRQPLQRELLQEVVASDSLFCLIIFVPHECDDALISWICEQCAV